MATQNYSEHDLQASCVKWFSAVYPYLGPLFFSVPNGAKTKHTEAQWMKAEGMKKGIADLILQVPSGTYSSLNIEMKSHKGVQSQEQKDYEQWVKAAGGQYVVCRTFEEFCATVRDYVDKMTPIVIQQLKELQKSKELRTVMQARAEYNKLKLRNHE
jgi:hypothetical protein